MDLPCEMLLHPELLSNEQLIYIIQQRQLRINSLQSLPRDELLEIFHHYCVPFGQRRYRDSGRGKVLNRTRHLSPENKPALNTFDPRQSNRKSVNNGHERIKPPPDLLSGHMKRIKIENKLTPVHTNSFKRRMSVEEASPVPDTPPPKKDRKPITWP